MSSMAWRNSNISSTIDSEVRVERRSRCRSLDETAASTVLTVLASSATIASIRTESRVTMAYESSAGVAGFAAVPLATAATVIGDRVYGAF